MTCPACKHPASEVTDTRPLEGAARIRRRRECMACGVRWTTYERIVDSGTQERWRAWHARQRAEAVNKM